jgi:HEAT repeat protein
MDGSVLRVTGILVLTAAVAFCHRQPPNAAAAAEAGPEMIRTLADGLRSDDATVRYRSSLALAKIGAAAVPALIEALHDPDWQARIAAANAVRDMKGAGAPAVSALAENLSYSADRELGYPPKEPSLYAGSPSLQVRWCAVAALGHIGPAALAAVPALLEMLRGAHENGLAGPRPDDAYGQRHWRAFELRGAAAWVIQKLGPTAAQQYPDVIAALGAALQDPKRMVRLNAAATLRAMGPAAKKAEPELLAALRHEDPYTRTYAALAFTAMGKDAAPHIPELIECCNSIRLDSLSRRRIAQVILAISGKRPRPKPEPTPTPEERWAALDRSDFFLVVQPFQASSLLIDPDKLIEAFVTSRMGNAITCWPDHTWYNTPAPTADQLKRWGMAMVWYFFTEDIFNSKLQRDWGFATVDDYNMAMTEQILETGRVLGRNRSFWAVGHEQMDNVGAWDTQADGSRKDPGFKTKQDGYDFYRKWLTTGIRKRHWMEYGNTRPGKFFDGWDTGAKETWEFLADHKVDTSPVTMVSGGVSPALAHASFDILPQIGMYWWECQIDGASLQVGSAYTRGASRQFGKKWLLDASSWSPVHGSPGWGYLEGKWTGGVTDEMQLRTWLYGYLSGAHTVLEESSGSTHFRIEPYPNGPSDRPVMTSTGRTAQRAARFCYKLCPDRGEPYNPAAVLLEQENGFEPRPHTNFRRQGAWGFMPMGEGEYEIEKFWQVAFPGHSSFPDRSKVDASDPCAVEPLILTESAFGDCFDVLTDQASQATMTRYPRLVTLGGIVIGQRLLQRLRNYVAGGGELLVNAAHLSGDASELAGVTLGDWIADQDPISGLPIRVREANPTTAKVLMTTAAGRPLIIVNWVGKGKVWLVTARHNLSGEQINRDSQWLPVVSNFLQRWLRRVWPASVTTRSGHSPQVLLNKLADGWLVTIGNHWTSEWRGVVRLDMPGGRPVSVTDIWRQSPIRCETGTRAITFPASARPYSFSVYRVGTAARP